MSRRQDLRDKPALNAGGTYRVPERVPPVSRPPAKSRTDSFAAELIQALEEAAAAPAVPVSPHQTWGKLQFDWPDVSAVELEAVARALLGNPLSALDAFPLSETLVLTVEDCARPRAPRPGKPAVVVELATRAVVEEEAQLAVRLAFQRLAAALLTCLSHLAGMPEEQAAGKLLKLKCAAPVLEDQGHGGVDVAGAESHPPHGNTDNEAAEDAHGSDSSDWEDFVVPPTSWPVPHPQAGDAADAAPTAADAATKLSWLLSRFSYRMVDLPGVWAEAKLTGVVLAILKALHDQHREAAWAPHAGIHLCHLLLDRWCSSASAVADADLPGVMRLLAAASHSRDIHDDGSPLRMLARLASQPRDIARAAWPQLHVCMGDVIAPLAERLSASHKQPREAVDEAASLFGDILACYALHAPGGSDVGGTLLRTCVLRSAAALLAQPQAPLALRTGVLVACARAPEACSYVAAVAGASATLADGCGDAVSCLWPLVAGGSSDALCSVLIAAHNGDAVAVKEAQEKLAVLLDCMRAAQAARPLWRPGDAVHAALLGLQSSLRGVLPEEPSGEEATDETSAADKAHSRRAALRRLVKEALSVADGTSQKKD